MFDHDHGVKSVQFFGCKLLEKSSNKDIFFAEDLCRHQNSCLDQSFKLILDKILEKQFSF